MAEAESHNEEKARLLALALAKVKRKAELDVAGFEDKETQADLRLESDDKEIQCCIVQQSKLSKHTQTKAWIDPLTEQRDIVKRFYVDSYGAISKSSPWRKIDEKIEAEQKERTINDGIGRGSKDTKLNFNTSFQTEELEQEKANFYITDIQVVTGTDKPKSGAQYNSVKDLQLASKKVGKAAVQIGIGDPSYESPGEERNNQTQESITQRERIKEKLLAAAKEKKSKSVLRAR